MQIEVWNAEGKQLVAIDDCLIVTADKTDFYVKCQNGLLAEVNLDNLNLILETKPAIVDEKALKLRELREKLKALFYQS